MEAAAARWRATLAPFAHLQAANGLYPDSVRLRPDVRAAKAAFWGAHDALGRFNRRFKPPRDLRPMGERLAARKAAREAAAAPA